MLCRVLSKTLFCVIGSTIRRFQFSGEPGNPAVDEFKRAREQRSNFRKKHVDFLEKGLAILEQVKSLPKSFIRFHRTCPLLSYCAFMLNRTSVRSFCYILRQHLECVKLIHSSFVVILMRNVFNRPKAIARNIKYHSCILAISLF